MNYCPSDATRSMNTHIFANFWNFAGSDSAAASTRPRVGGREALSPPAKFQTFEKMKKSRERVCNSTISMGEGGKFFYFFNLFNELI